MKIIINGETADPSFYERELQNIQRQNPGISAEDAAKEARESVVEWALIRQESAKSDEKTDTRDIDREFDEMAQTHGGKQAFFERFGLTGADEQNIRKDIEQNLKIRRFLDKLTEDIPEPAGGQVVEFFDKNKEHYIHPEEIHAAHIVKHPNQENAEELYAELVKIRREILDGADFMEMADRHSTCNDSSPDLGFFPKGQMVPEFEAVAFSMNEGEVSPVIQTQFGYHIVKVLEKKAARPMELDECRSDITEMLHHDLKNEAIGKWVDQQKAAASVEIIEDEETVSE